MKLNVCIKFQQDFYTFETFSKKPKKQKQNCSKNIILLLLSRYVSDVRTDWNCVANGRKRDMLSLVLIFIRSFFVHTLTHTRTDVQVFKRQASVSNQLQ